MRSLYRGLQIVAWLGLPALLFAQADRSYRSANDETEEFSQSYKMRGDRDVRLRLIVDAGEIHVSRGSSTDQISVKLVYTKKQFTHVISNDQRNNELDITFDKKGWFEYDSDRMTARVEMELPTEVPLRIYSRIKAGEVDMQLGGMRIVEFTLKTWAGQVDVDFDEPNQTTMSYLEINTKIGESSLRNLGNARFQNADINGGIGEMSIDFRGDMMDNASADVDLDIGETVILLPEKCGTKMLVSKFPVLSQVKLPYRLEKEGRYYYTKDNQEAGKVFELRLSSGIGELRIE